MVTRIDFEAKNGTTYMVHYYDIEAIGRAKEPWTQVTMAQGGQGVSPPEIFLFLDSIWWLLVHSGGEFIRNVLHESPVQKSRKPNVPKLKHADDNILRKKMTGHQKK